MNKLCVRWVPRLPTFEQKQQAHTSAVIMSKIQKIRFQLQSHPPYSTDLAPRNCYLLPNFLKWLRGQKIFKNEDVTAALNGYFEDLDENSYCVGIKKLSKHLTKCVFLNNDNVEK